MGRIMIRTVGLAVIFLFAASAAGHAQNACDALMNEIVTAHGLASDVVNKESPAVTQFFIRETDLPCHRDILVMVQGRIKCTDGKRATIQGRFDVGDLGGGTNTYILLTDSDHATCR